jgi:hypothetical protein
MILQTLDGGDPSDRSFGDASDALIDLSASSHRVDTHHAEDLSDSF